MPAVFFEKKDEEKIMIPERLAALREKMRAYGVDAYLVPTADYHESEYVGTYFKARTYITGFTGSAGTAVITQDEACLWTDGRYFVQAAKELAGTGVTLMKMGQEGVPTVEEYLQANTKEGMTIGFDGRVVNEMLGETLEKTLPERFLSYRSDLIGEIWSDRPALSAEPVWILDSKYTGESAADRLAKVREKMKENGAEVHILTALDDIAWMLNIRGNDIPCNPVVLSYLILTETEGHLFIQEATLNDEVKQYLAGLGISIHPYDAVYDFAAGITGKTILLEKAKVNYTICQSVMGENTIVNVMNPASYASMDSLTFLFDIGLTYQNTITREGSLKENSQSGSLDYIVMQFPLGRYMAGSVGLLPYSNVGYSFINSIDNGSDSRSGDGNISQAYVGVSGRPFKGFSIGANIIYIFW